MSEPLKFETVLKAIKKASSFGVGARVDMSGQAYVDILMNDLEMTQEDALKKYEEMRNEDGTVTLKKTRK